ncbi:MAG: hypothetical protein ACR2PS_18450 [Pseudomonadales bacterium]
MDWADKQAREITNHYGFSCSEPVTAYQRGLIAQALRDERERVAKLMAFGFAEGLSMEEIAAAIRGQE